MNDLATPQMDSILNDLTPKIDRIFNDSQYDVVVTGVSRVFLEGTKFLVGNLTYSLVLSSYIDFYIHGVDVSIF